MRSVFPADALPCERGLCRAASQPLQFPAKPPVLGSRRSGHARSSLGAPLPIPRRRSGPPRGAALGTQARRAGPGRARRAAMEVGAESFAHCLPRLRRRILRATFVGERLGRLVRPQCCPGAPPSLQRGGWPLPDVGTRALRGTAAHNGAAAARDSNRQRRLERQPRLRCWPRLGGPGVLGVRGGATNTAQGEACPSEGRRRGSWRCKPHRFFP